MPFPQSPFSEGFNTDVLFEHGSERGVPEIQNVELCRLTAWLCSTPKISTYRVNTLVCTVEDAVKGIQDELEKISKQLNIQTPAVYTHPNLPEVVVVENYKTSQLDLNPKEQEVIIDIYCAAAVLRGAHIFAPGIIGMTSGTKVGSVVSIYADVAKKCKKGYQKVYEEANKVLIGNGVVKMNRHMLFGENILISGIAVIVITTTSGCPSLTEGFLPKGSVLLQNLPSVVCVNVLNPQPNDLILDMCASPGNKTTHIASKMNNIGTLIAIDKTPAKYKQLENTCVEFKSNVHIFQADSTKIFDTQEGSQKLIDGPPFATECFDKILLDAPCSALGKRPQLLNTDSEKVIRSYVPLQRKLFTNAVNLLKINGSLVYSTCTITVAENEGIVAWALRTFPCIQLVNSEPKLGGSGWHIDGLTSDDLKRIQRYGPNDNVDSVGFFLAKFIKNKSCL